MKSIPKYSRFDSLTATLIGGFLLSFFTRDNLIEVYFTSSKDLIEAVTGTQIASDVQARLDTATYYIEREIS